MPRLGDCLWYSCNCRAYSMPSLESYYRYLPLIGAVQTTRLTGGFSVLIQLSQVLMIFLNFFLHLQIFCKFLRQFLSESPSLFLIQLCSCDTHTTLKNNFSKKPTAGSTNFSRVTNFSLRKIALTCGFFVLVCKISGK